MTHPLRGPMGVFSDFDGTITLHDCNDDLVRTFVGDERRMSYDLLFSEGQTVLWRLLDSSMQACAIPLERAISHLRTSIILDPTFAPFEAWCRAEAIPLAIVSAGLDAVIAAFLADAGLSLPVTANQVRHLPGHFGLVPLDPACPTGVDKAQILRDAQAAGLYTVFVGDGFSDRQAVEVADLVYAKSGLARYCAQREIAFVPFERFSDIQVDLAARRHAAQLP